MGIAGGTAVGRPSKARSYNAGNNLQEEYNKLQAVDVHIVAMLGIEFDAS